MTKRRRRTRPRRSCVAMAGAWVVTRKRTASGRRLVAGGGPVVSKVQPSRVILKNAGWLDHLNLIEF